ncbi:CYFA0S09e02256g1_1 [Cyberlindnera fabianii]|uniref:Aldehyde dehydrogenase [NAD(P)+] 1 n=1 Tax=Cyberlindnera fabianii TaxID=36022 RepID=A0A061B5S3_CYBFA|nr:Aldehyde dehydrogenase [NAD(P)+] 1 [Cyberlindnera fabianii]CDR42375.1 CYFA0S09e02256g1_1 [Cyberlindnera fabianii]
MSLSTSITLADGTVYEQPLGLFINNEFVKGSGELIDTYDPHTTKLITSVHCATAADVDVAVKAAKTAYDTVWSKIDQQEKGKLLWKLGDLMEKYGEIIGKIDSVDGGKPYYTNCVNDIAQCVALTRYYAGFVDKIPGKHIQISEDKFVYEVQEPYGVVGQIVPWNYPFAMAQWKVISALAAGNTVVIKTAETTPLSMLFFGNLIKEAGFPPGVLNILSGYGKDAGSAIASHMEIEKVSFTGSTTVGRLIASQAAMSNLKSVTLECGGKSPLVVFPDANIKSAVTWSSMGIFYNSGQNCTANSRIILHESIYDEFLEAFKKHTAENWIIGDPLEKTTTVGPLVSKVHYEKVTEFIKKGENEGLKKLIGDEPVTLSSGYYVQPTIFLDVPTTSELWQEEIFGPVAVVAKFKTYDEAVELANATKYGLAAMVFTKNIKRGHRFASAMKSGSMYINSSNDEDIRAAFGGYGLSGEGGAREMGEQGLLIYTQTKAVHVNLAVEEEDDEL